MITLYVKWIKSTGARVVPLILCEPIELTTRKMSKFDDVFSR